MIVRRALTCSDAVPPVPGAEIPQMEGPNHLHIWW